MPLALMSRWLHGPAIRTADSSTYCRRATSAAMAGAQVLEGGVGCGGRMSGPLEVVLDRPDGASRRADANNLTKSEYGEKAGAPEVERTHAQEAGPGRDATAV